jgi:hypothetical protein
MKTSSRRFLHLPPPTSATTPMRRRLQLALIVLNTNPSSALSQPASPTPVPSSFPDTRALMNSILRPLTMLTLIPWCSSAQESHHSYAYCKTRQARRTRHASRSRLTCTLPHDAGSRHRLTSATAASSLATSSFAATVAAAPFAAITTSTDLTATAIASAAFTSAASREQTDLQRPAYLLRPTAARRPPPRFPPPPPPATLPDDCPGLHTDQPPRLKTESSRLYSAQLAPTTNPGGQPSSISHVSPISQMYLGEYLI